MVLGWLLGRAAPSPTPPEAAGTLDDVIEVTHQELLGFLDARSLCRLEACVPRRRGVGEPVARRRLAHHRSASLVAALAPTTATQSWKQALRMSELGLLDPATRRGDGVEALERLGWRHVYDECCDHATSDAHLDRVPAAARAVFVAATQGDDFYAGRQVTLGAWGPRAAVLDPAGAPAAGAGVAFYRRPDAFGFEFRGPSTFRDDRLHWNLDRTITTGGWFAGEALQFGGTGPWRKLLLYRE